MAELIVNDVENPIRLQGQYVDSETGLIYDRHRYFSAVIGGFISTDPLGLDGGESTYRFAPNVLGWRDPLGLTCSASLKSIEEQLSRGKTARVTVATREEAEEVLRALTTGRGHASHFRNTTHVPYDLRGSQWLPENVDRGPKGRYGTYHWDEFNPNAPGGDHAIEGEHLQIHDWEGRVITVFY